jgi:hypothetical protein
MKGVTDFLLANWQLWAGFAAGWLVFKRPEWIEFSADAVWYQVKRLVGRA